MEMLFEPLFALEMLFLAKRWRISLFPLLFAISPTAQKQTLNAIHEI